MGGSGTQKPGDEPEPSLEPNTAAGRHAGKDVLDGSGLGLQVPALLMEPVSRVSFRHGAGLASGPDGVDTVGENLEIKGLERTYKGGAGRAHMRPVPC